jgi:1-acyl-sn-glycerol-3-phosphate acyltransferase
MEPEAPTVDRQSPFFNAVMLPLAKAVSWVLFTLLGPTRIRSRTRVPRQGGLLILANHRSDVDPVLVQLACPRTVYFMAKSELFQMPILGWVIRFFRAFPVRRGEPDKASVKKAVGYLRAGETVCVFPEGELSETGGMLPLKPGVALIVRMAGVPVICLGLRGTARVLPYGKVIPRPALGWVEAHWGEPRAFELHASGEEILAWAEGELRRLTGEPETA